MYSKMFYTEKHHIPAFSIIHTDTGETFVEFKNPRTKVTERIRLIEFISLLFRDL